MILNFEMGLWLGIAIGVLVSQIIILFDEWIQKKKCKAKENKK